MTHMSVAERLEKAIEESGKSQREIAAEVGYPRPNVLSMMKQGQTKIPLEKAPLLARACGLDPADFTRHAMQEYMPAVWETLAATFGESLTPAERRCLSAYRKVVARTNREPEVTAEMLHTSTQRSEQLQGQRSGI